MEETKIINEIETKVCAQCGRELPLTEFQTTRSGGLFIAKLKARGYSGELKFTQIIKL